MLRSLLTLFLVVMIPALAMAQTATPPAAQTATPPVTQPQPPPPQRTVPGWPDPLNSNSYSTRLDIVTIASPGIPQHCHVRALTADAITCRAGHHRPEIVFQRSDILYLIYPSENRHPWEVLAEFFAVGTTVVIVTVALVFVFTLLAALHGL